MYQDPGYAKNENRKQERMKQEEINKIYRKCTNQPPKNEMTVIPLKGQQCMYSMYVAGVRTMIVSKWVW